jgi:hypothetical protein
MKSGMQLCGVSGGSATFIIVSGFGKSWRSEITVHFQQMTKHHFPEESNLCG